MPENRRGGIFFDSHCISTAVICHLMWQLLTARDVQVMTHNCLIHPFPVSVLAGWVELGFYSILGTQVVAIWWYKYTQLLTVAELSG